MQKIPLWLALIVPLALGAGAAAAAPRATPAERAELLAERRERLKEKWEAEFRAADRDENRALTRAEAEAAHLPPSLLEHFAEIDTDGDGGLTPEELMAMYQKRVEAQQAPALK